MEHIYEPQRGGTFPANAKPRTATTQTKHTITSIPILTPHSDNAPNEAKQSPPQNPTIMHPQNHFIYINRPRRALQGRHPFIAQGASPGLIVATTFLSSVGAALFQRMQSHRPQRHKPNACSVSTAPAELNPFLPVCTQGSISGFALITPWAMKKCSA